MTDRTKKLREYIEARSIPIPFAGCWLWLLSCHRKRERDRG